MSTFRDLLYHAGMDDNLGTWVTGYVAALVIWLVGVLVALAGAGIVEGSRRTNYFQLVCWSLQYLFLGCSMALGGFTHQFFANVHKLGFKGTWITSLICLGIAGACLVAALGRTIFFREAYHFGPFHPQWWFVAAAFVCAIVNAILIGAYKKSFAIAACFYAVPGLLLIGAFIYRIVRWKQPSSYHWGNFMKLQPCLAIVVLLLGGFGFAIIAAGVALQMATSHKCATDLDKGCPFPDNYNHNAICITAFAVGSMFVAAAGIVLTAEEDEGGDMELSSR